MKNRKFESFLDDQIIAGARNIDEINEDTATMVLFLVWGNLNSAVNIIEKIKDPNESPLEALARIAKKITQKHVVYEQFLGPNNPPTRDEIIAMHEGGEIKNPLRLVQVGMHIAHNPVYAQMYAEILAQPENSNDKTGAVRKGILKKIKKAMKKR